MSSSVLNKSPSNNYKRHTIMRSNTQICLSFGRDEVELLQMLDEGRKEEYLSRSAWFKNQIREKYGKKKNLQRV